MAIAKTIIGVNDVQKSYEWYQALLGCTSGHGGDSFEILLDNSGEILLYLHRWGDHEHPTLTAPCHKPGNGLILYISVDSLQDTWQNAEQLGLSIAAPIAKSANSGKMEFALRDLDNYYVLLAQK